MSIQAVDLPAIRAAGKSAVPSDRKTQLSVVLSPLIAIREARTSETLETFTTVHGEIRFLDKEP